MGAGPNVTRQPRLNCSIIILAPKFSAVSAPPVSQQKKRKEKKSLKWVGKAGAHFTFFSQEYNFENNF